MGISLIEISQALKLSPSDLEKFTLFLRPNKKADPKEITVVSVGTNTHTIKSGESEKTFNNNQSIYH